MAARNLTEKHRRAAIIFGGAGAIILLIAFCGCWAYCSMCLTSSWWAASCCSGSHQAGGRRGRRRRRRAHEQLWPAIWSIAFANTVMSLDNAIAHHRRRQRRLLPDVHGADHQRADHHRRRRHHFRPARPFPLARSGRAALIGWIAGEVISAEGRREELRPDGTLVEVVQPGSIAAWLDGHVPHAELVVSLVGAMLVLALGMIIGRIRQRRSKSS